MGSSVIARCSCGYDTEVQTGCGFAGPTPDYFPALCRMCAEVVPADATASPTTCDDCGSKVELYDAPELQQKKGRRTVVDGRTLTVPEIRHRLNNGAYLCPTCGRFELRFEIGGMCWD